MPDQFWGQITCTNYLRIYLEMTIPRFQDGCKVDGSCVHWFPAPKTDLQLKHFKGYCKLSIVNVMTCLTQVELQKGSQCPAWWAEPVQLLEVMDGESTGELATLWLGLSMWCAPLHGNQTTQRREGLRSCKLTIRTKYWSKCPRTYKLQSSKGCFGHILFNVE